MTRRDAGTEEQRRAKCLKAIVAAGEKVDLERSLPVDRKRFLHCYYEQAELEEVDRDPRMLAAAALTHLKWASTRRPRSAKIRVFNPTLERDGWVSEHTVVQTANDNMPFLVDSLTMRLNAMGHAIHVTVHPQVLAERSAKGELLGMDAPSRAEPPPNAKRESFIHFEIVKETDPKLLAAIERALHDTLRDVRAAVEDWQPMLGKLRDAVAELRASEGLAIPADLLEESCAFLEWLAGDNFTLLGYREYELTAGEKADELRSRPDTGLGLLRDDAANEEVVRISGRAREAARSSTPLVITKANRRSTVHRPARLDHIGVKVFDANGEPYMERRFLGLFTSVAYNESPRDIPLLRHKVRSVMSGSGFDPRGHRGKSLQHILDTFPRDDLFQASVEDLRATSRGILRLQERHKIKLFCRRETFGRFFSCLVYLPRDQYNQRARRAIEQVLLGGLAGTEVESEVTISESALARLAVTVRTPPTRHAEPDVDALQAEIELAVRTWSDRLRETLLAELPEEEALELLHRFGDHFSVAYQEEADAARASHDIRRLAKIHEGESELEMVLAKAQAPHLDRLRFTTFKPDEPIQLYVALPLLENMGFKVISERIYPVELPTSQVWIQDFELATATGDTLDPPAVEERIKECFAVVLAGEADNDGFNGFVVSAGLDWRQAALLRALCRYILQTGVRYSQSYMQEVLARYPDYSRALIDRFESLFDVDCDTSTRSEKRTASEKALQRDLDRTVSLDDDRILRTFGAVLNAIVRTNYYQRIDGRPKHYLSLKLDSSALPDLPKPRPKFEIFVHSQRVEGVHLRCAKIARGGIRWSDRREDFRTEVLGLMKAQQVKNTVIVPSGAKGGFVCKALPIGDRDAVQLEVVECYKTFIRGLLDLTDNLADGRVVSPERVIRRDSDDPYLVVAADKGTASFSDIANDLAAEYGFWLGDAFASGGSAGYDHKKMGITARGAWEAVKRHFRELGLDPAKSAFTAVGVGDMSGDVFGNGMLLSPHTKLIAAFNHQHIFIDPDPDTERSFAERRRLFDLPRSTWDDYDRKALSPGGGVYSRQSKSIELAPAAQKALGVDRATLTPPEVIKAVLTAPCDLFWNGGIGTYVKAAMESHADAGDPTNDAVRVNGADLRCRVVAEGGNLGLTQLGRIEYALHGGRINTDFIDNSGGVDSSDREVNIKILLDDAIRRKKLKPTDRNKLLAQMTDEVAALVLASNYAQTQALSMMESRAAERLGEHARLIRVLETQGLLDRAIEFLPTEDQIEERRIQSLGLTRPELAVILSYSKIELTGSLEQTDIPEDPFVAAELEAYFPPELVKRFKPLLREHRLAREIIAMLVAGSMINRMGPFFVLRAEEETGASVAQVARAYAIVREVFGVRRLWRDIEALDYTVDAKVQYDTIFGISRMVRRAVYWFLQNYPEELDVEPMVERFRPGLTELLSSIPALVSGRSEERFERDLEHGQALGLPRPMAKRIAAFELMTQALDVIELAHEFSLPVGEIGKLYLEQARELKLDWIREHIEGLKVDGRWRAMARATLRETLAREQRALLRSALSGRRGAAPDAALHRWLDRNEHEIARVLGMLEDMQLTGPLDFATLAVALKEVGSLA